MSDIKPLHKMSYLVVDDFPSARKSIRSMLGQLGVENVFEAGTAIQAKKILKDRPIDIVICDFNLGPGQDGQQLLEEMRSTRAITHMTQWVIITAETSKDMVMGAVENQPDDYLAKPFAFDTFKLRLEKWVKRINTLQPLLTALDSNETDAIVTACEETIAHQPRYRAWARKILISTLIQDKQLDKAEKLLNAILEKRQQDWALHDKARVAMLRNDVPAAVTMLEEVITTNPNNMAAYDDLAECFQRLKQTEKAQQTLLNATRISPRNLKRQRTLAELSRKERDYPVATRAYKEVLTLATNTRHDRPENYINLVETLNQAARSGLDQELNNASRQALQVAQRMGQQYPENIPLQIKSRILQADSLDIQGLESARDGELKKVFDSAMRHLPELKQDFGMDIATAFYRYDKQQQGDDWVEALRKHYADDVAYQQKLLVLQSEPVSERAKKRAAEYNKAGNTSYREEDYKTALHHFSQALEYSPRHPGLIMNIVQAHLKLYQQQADRDHLRIMENYLRRLTYLPRDHHQFERYQALLKRLLALKEEHK